MSDDSPQKNPPAATGLSPRAANLPAGLQKTKQLLNLVNALARPDDGWFASLCAWADEFAIPPQELPRDAAALQALRELKIHRSNWGRGCGYPYPFHHYPTISYLPAAIARLSRLHSLDLSGNRLTALPPEITRFANLQTLYLGSNQLTALPPEIGQLANLQKLYLRRNQLTTLPPEIGQLANLQTLDLQDNQLTTLPPGIGQLANLQTLDLQDNQLTTLPPEIGQSRQFAKTFAWQQPTHHPAARDYPTRQFARILA